MTRTCCPIHALSRCLRIALGPRRRRRQRPARRSPARPPSGPRALTLRSLAGAAVVAALSTAAYAAPGGRTLWDVSPERRIASLAAADLDGDGVPELVLFDALNALLLVQRIVAGGDALAEIGRIPVGFDTASVSALDVDGDGRVDLVTASEGSLNLRIDFGDGRGGIAETRELVLPGAVKGLAVADFDGDTVLDVATAGGGDAQVFVHRGLGARAYERGPPLSTPFPQPHTIAAGDFDGDGDADLAVGGKDDGDAPAYFAVLENRGGAFGEAIVPALPEILDGVGVGREGLAAADFDRDGRDEIVFAPERGETLYQLDVGIDGAYAVEAAGALAEGLGRLRVADLDGDGSLDILGVVPDLGTVYLFKNGAAAPPAFEPACIVQPSAPALDVAAAPLAAGEPPRLILAENHVVEAVADPLADCRDATLCAGRQGCFSVSRGESTLPFSRLAVLAPAGGAAGTGGLLVVDDGSLRFLAADAAGPFAEVWRMRSFAVAGGVAAGDLDGDGRSDFVLSDLGGGSLQVYLRAVETSPPLEPESLPVGLLPGAVAVADVDRDDRLDVAAVLRGEDRIALLHGAGDGRFTSPVFIPCGAAPRDLACGDLDGDGDPDAVVAGEDRAVRVLANDGDGGFAAPEELAVTAQAVRIGELDGAPPAELVLLAEDRVTVIGFAGGDPGEPRFLRVAGGLAMELGDVDGDGVEEIALAELSGAIRVLRLAPSGLEPLDAPLSLCARARTELALGDADGDGKADIFAGLPGANELRRFRFDDCGAPAAFRRGDADGTGTVDLTDAVGILNALFLGGPAARCADAADADDDGTLNLTDAVNLLNHLFLGGPPPPAPGPEACGGDPSADALAACAATCR